MGSNKEKSNIAIAILEKIPFLKGKQIISYFDGSNNIFADCTYPEYTNDNCLLNFTNNNKKNSWLIVKLSYFKI